ILIVGIFSVFTVGHVRADENKEYEPIDQVITQYLKERTKYSGTLDIYDESIDGVRNLKKLSVAQEIEKNDNLYTKVIDYRDLNEGVVVTVKIVVEEIDGEYEVKDPEIQTVHQKAMVESEEGVAKKEFTDKDIQQAMKDYFDQKMKFTGTFDLFDPEQQKMKKLKLVKLDEQIRKFGVLNISSAEFKDQETGKTVMVDITIENKNGKLNVKNVREKK
ncbi:MAG: hypothetical protein KC733_11825, partial [Candidatus Omnitrophica bacterium]|nr:hypothetical protein [Candidatus Omnitrophota bacterium]